MRDIECEAVRDLVLDAINRSDAPLAGSGNSYLAPKEVAEKWQTAPQAKVSVLKNANA